ncbi:interleukin-1 receptor-associated kinase 1 isoform X1 [Lates japonicus]|uniref:Interleukin-1 receptor-associated kinase 1 isoform X1 n=1 Tax=Lates japonicus TaxID=270547 RepID=A0AAD3RIE8_LATJO|nr:interleukin-1 receptor-associated kinase 1 isoform X1 [Lates japonicus]
MSGVDLRGQFLYHLPSSVLWEFCRVMDGLSDLDWTRFASEVLGDQTAVRLDVRKERRTDWVMNQWENRNGRVGELIDLLERLQLFRPRDVILGWMSSPRPFSSLPPPPRPPPASHHPHISLPHFDPPPKPSEATPTLSTLRLTMTADGGGGGRPLPGPDPPPIGLKTEPHRPPPQPSQVAACGGGGRVMCWSFEEVHAGTDGFSPSLQVGEGGFGVVYRATLNNTDCAVKRLKQDGLLDLTLLTNSFQTEVENLSRFRHPNIVDLLGFSEGGGSVVRIMEEVSTALQFLHSPPDGYKPLIHGDVKSSNILLDRHLVAKLADFGLARLASGGSSGRSVTQTASVGKTETVRGTLAYLPDEYVRNRELGPAVDVFSFGVVLLEVLTGRRALEKDKKLRESYLKDLVEEVSYTPSGSSAAAWRKHLDQRLITGGAADPPACMQLVSLACTCLDKKRKKRPAMTEVFHKLQEIHREVKTIDSSPSSPRLHHPPPPSQAFPRPPCSLDSSMGALSNQLSRLGPLEDTYQPSSSLCALTLPHPLHSSSSLSSSFVGPCETDESRGLSQFRSDGTSSRSLSPSSKDQYHCPTPFSHPSVSTQDQYHFPPLPGSSRDRPGAGALTGPETTGGGTGGATVRLYDIPGSLSPAGSLQSSSPGPSVDVNPSKQRFLEKKTLYEEGQIQTPELLSSDDLYGGVSSESRGPEESNELDYLPVKHN